MPPLIHDEDDATDAEVPNKSVREHAESNVEADVHAKDQLKDELMEDIEMSEGAEAAAEEKTRLSPTASNRDDDPDSDSADEDEESYEVEEIVDHEWKKKKKGKGFEYVLLYNVKWKGYDSSENTLEPEENLISSRDLLASYHHKIGGAPQPPTERDASVKKKRSTKSLTNNNAASAAEESPAPPAKRQKRNKEEDGELSDAGGSPFGSWVPKGTNWEAEIKAIETVERDALTNDLYILMLFKNGKKSRVKNAMMRKRAPQRLLDFYEAHLSV